jgi:tripeptide aminopeptidase
MNTDIIEEFAELVKIPVQSRDERKIADVLKQKLTSMGLSVVEDSAGEKLQGNTGNIIARLPGELGIPAILLSAHMDRVGNDGAIRPVSADNGTLLRSSGNSILAADDVGGLCAILAGLRQVLAEGCPHGDIEVVFSICEELGVAGSRCLDFSQLQSRQAYVLDAPGRIGRIVLQAPTKCKIQVRVKGRSAHAGSEPEKGLSAIRVAAVALSRLREGRITPYTTANFGSFHGGSSTNVVCDAVEILGEVRSLKQGEMDAYIDEIKKVFADTAAEYHAKIEVQVQVLYHSFSLSEELPVVQTAKRALAGLGISPVCCAGGGGMDGNHFNVHGISTVGLTLGYTKNHTPEEQIIVQDLIKAGDLVKALITETYKNGRTAAE